MTSLVGLQKNATKECYKRMNCKTSVKRDMSLYLNYTKYTSDCQRVSEIFIKKLKWYLKSLLIIIQYKYFIENEIYKRGNNMDYSKVYKALPDPIRLDILRKLSNGEMNAVRL